MPQINLRISDEDLAAIDAEAERAGLSRTALMIARAKAPDAGEAARAVAALEDLQRRLLDLLSVEANAHLVTMGRLHAAVDAIETALDPPKPKRSKKRKLAVASATASTLDP